MSIEYFNDADPILDEFPGAPGYRDREPWLNTERAAAYLCCDPRRVRDLVASGRLRGVRDGTRWLVRASDIDNYLKGNG